MSTQARSIRNCSVAVVGGAGFLGSHLVNFLIEGRNCKVLVVDNLVAGRREFVHKDAEFVHHDITGSEEFMTKLFKQRNILFAFNFAAYPYVPTSFVRPLHVSDINFMGAIKVINAAQEAGAEAILQVSSAEIYGDGSDNAKMGNARLKGQEDFGVAKITETTTVRPHSTYGAAKAAVDYFCQCAWRERRTPVIALRQFNCVGERDETHPYVLPEIIKQLSVQLQYPKNYTLNVEGVGTVRLGNNSFRDFLYAGDQARLAVELLELGNFGEVYNLGSETGIKMYDLAKLVGKLMGFAEVKVEEDPVRKRPWEIWHLQSDNSKIWNALYGRVGQKRENPLPPSATGPRLTSLEDALRKTIEYFRANGWRFAW